MFKKEFIASLLCVFLVCSPVWAANKPGFYTKSSSLELLGRSNLPAAPNKKSPLNSWDFDIGYQFNPYFSLEAGYNNTNEDLPNLAAIAATSSIPITKQLDAFIQFGMTGITNNSDNVSTPNGNPSPNGQPQIESNSPFYGIGLNYRFSK